MINFRHNIEALFEKAASIIYTHRIKTIIIFLLFIAFLASNIRFIRLDTSTESFLYKNDPILIDYNLFRDRFGRDEMVIVAVKSENIFSHSFISKLKKLHRELDSNVPYVKTVTSLVNARLTRGEEDELIVEDLLDSFEEGRSDLKAIRDLVLSNEAYKNQLISEDGTFTTLVIESVAYGEDFQTITTEEIDKLFEEDFDTIDSQQENSGTKGPKNLLSDKQNSEFVNAIKKITSAYDSPDFTIHLAGSPLITDTLKRSMIKDASRFILLLIFTIFFILAVLFRRITGVVFPLIVIISTVISTIGLMCLFRVPVTLPTNMLNPFMLAIGVGDSVHILSLFFYNMRHGMDKKTALVKAMGHSGLAVLMTSLTTAAGLFSFSFAEVAPIASLGKFGCAGVMLALLYTIILIPALISLFPIGPGKEESIDKKKSFMDKVLLFFINLSTRHPVKITAGSLFLIMISSIFIFRISFSYNPMSWLPRHSSLEEDTMVIDKELKGTTTLEVIIDTKKAGELYEPAILNTIEKANKQLHEYEKDGFFVGKVFSINTIIKEINRALNENNDEYYSIPDERGIIAEELLLFELSGSDDLAKLADFEYRTTRVTVKTPWMDAIVYKDFVAKVESLYKKTFGEKAEITITGMVSLLSRTVSATMISTAKSYIIAFLSITIMMILLIGSIRIGLLSMVPNIFPILFVIGIMGILGIAMDMFVMLTGCIAIGLAVDDTIHFMHNFRRYYSRSGDAADAVKQTLLTAGRAMITTSIVLCCGFFVFLFAQMKNFFNFGLLTGIAIFIALLADFLLAPALMVLVTRKKTDKHEKNVT